MNDKHTIIGLELLRSLATEGFKIFSIQDAKNIAPQIGMKLPYLAEALMHLTKRGWITRLKKGLYAFSPSSGFSSPPHDFEIAQSLVYPSAISHWTAMHYHQMTQQTPNIIYSTYPKGVLAPRKQPFLNRFHYIRVKKEGFIGIEEIWIDDTKIAITNPERTLIGALQQPKYCGDFYEILEGFKVFSDKIDPEKIISYAKTFGGACIKRLGWVLEKVGFPNPILETLHAIPIKGFRLLNPNGLNYGAWNQKWMIRENI